MKPSPPPFSYRLLSLVLFPFWCLHAVWHGLQYRQPDYIRKRLGLENAGIENAVWFHVASVGETEFIKPLISALSDMPVVVTTFTASGYLHARRILPQSVRVMVLPIDFQPISKRFIRRNRFRLGLVGETELWPETLYQAAASSLPILQINARLSAKTDRAAPWIRRIHRTTLSYFTCQLARTDKDRERFIRLGADPDKIHVCGNLKHVGNHDEEEYARRIERPYLLFASTHDSEELGFAGVLDRLADDRLAVIAPRHPQRGGTITRELSALGLNVSRRSKEEPVTDATDVYLVDTLGELKAFMAHADLVVMGGSFDDTGGHNVLEPARLGCAIITGPSDRNIQQDIAYLADHEAIVQADSLEDLATQIERLLHHPEQREALGQNARHAMQQSAAVLDAYLARIRDYLPVVADD